MRGVVPWRRATAVAVAFGLLAAACGGDDDSSEDAGGDGGSSDSALAGCPDPLIVQTDWFPEPEHGGLYQLIGPDGEADPEAGTYSGEIGDTGVTLEIRAGGPYLGNQGTSAVMYSDQDIFMGFVSTDSAIKNSADLPMVAVVSPLDKSPQILMWDPEAFPDIESFEDIGETGAPVLYFEGAAYMDYLVGKGYIDESQRDASYDGSPSRFVTEEVFQQGFASMEPYAYENDIDEFGRPVDYLLIHDAGFEIYPGSLSVRPERVTEDAECLEALVPLIQQGQVDYMADPEPINDAMLDYVDSMASYWVLSAEGNANAVEVMLEDEIVGNGSDDVIGNFDVDRVQTLIDEAVPIFEEVGVDSMTDGLTAEDIVTNEFIDETISLPSS